MCGVASLGGAESSPVLRGSLRPAPATWGSGMASRYSTGAGLLRPRHAIDVLIGVSGPLRRRGAVGKGQATSTGAGGVRVMRNGIPNFRLILVMSSWRDDVVDV